MYWLIIGVASILSAIAAPVIGYEIGHLIVFGKFAELNANTVGEAYAVWATLAIIAGFTAAMKEL